MMQKGETPGIYTMHFEDEITSAQRINVEKIIQQIARHYQITVDDYSLEFKDNTFIFETLYDAVYETLAEGFEKVEGQIKGLDENGGFTNSAIKKIFLGNAQAKPQTGQNVIHLKNLNVKDSFRQKEPYKGNFNTAREYFLTRKDIKELELSITWVKDAPIRIRSTDPAESEILKRVFAKIVESDKAIGRDEIGQSYVTERRKYRAEVKTQNKKTPLAAAPNPISKTPEKKINLYPIELTEEQIPHLPELLRVFNLSRNSKTPGYLLKAFGNATIAPEHGNEKSLEVRLPAYDDVEETNLTKSIIIEGLQTLALSAKSGTKRISRDSLILHFEKLKRISGISSQDYVNPHKRRSDQTKTTSKAPLPTQFTLPKIDNENVLKIGEEKNRLSAHDIAFMKSMDDRAVVMAMGMKEPVQNQSKEIDKVWLAAYKALDGLRKKEYHRILIAGDVSQYFHIQNVLKQIEHILGHSDAAQGKILLDTLVQEKRIEVTNAPLYSGPENKQAFVLLNGSEDYSWEQLTEVLKKTATLSTIAFIGNDENYDNQEHASDYKFFYDRFTKSSYAKHIRGFVFDGEPISQHEVLQTILLNGDDQPPQILSNRTSITKPPAPEMA